MSGGDVEFSRGAYNACQRGDATKQQQQSAASQIILLHAEIGRLRSTLKAWGDWHRFATRDDDNEYLNGKGWDDAEALAETTISTIERPLSTRGEAR